MYKTLLSVSMSLVFMMVPASVNARAKSRVLATKGFGECDGPCSISASPRVLQSSQEWVSVEVRGVTWGAPTDWIGAFATGDISDDGLMMKYPIRWQFANTTCLPRDKLQKSDGVVCAGEACCKTNDYVTAGSATVSFEVVNIRSDYIFALVQGNAQYPQVVAISNKVSFARPNEPLQAHLSLTHLPTQMRITWVSGANLSYPATARWGENPEFLTWEVVSDEARTYRADQMCPHTPASTLGYRDPGVTYSALMSGLKPGVRYFYAFGSDDPSSAWRQGANFTFMAPPRPGANQSVTFAAFGDMGKAVSAWDGTLEHSFDNPPGQGELGSWNTTALLMTEVLSSVSSMVLHIGDLSYAVGYSSEWDEFMGQIEAVSSRIPWMTGIGNHERNCPCADGIFPWTNGSDSGGECGVPYNNRFIMPPPSVPSASPSVPSADPALPNQLGRDTDTPWYTFKYGPVSVIMMSTEHDFTPSSKQYEDLERYLSAVDRTETPWVIFTGHRPMYVDSVYPAVEGSYLQKHIEPLLLAHAVDLALWGHHHSYHRSCPLISGVCSKGGVPHAVIGAAGYEFSPVNKGVNISQWRVFAEDTYYGVARLTVNATTLRFSFVRSDSGEIADEFYIQH